MTNTVIKRFFLFLTLQSSAEKLKEVRSAVFKFNTIYVCFYPDGFQFSM